MNGLDKGRSEGQGTPGEVTRTVRMGDAPLATEDAGWGEDTIVAISTAGGAGAIGIVRLSGPEAITLAEKAFTPGGERGEGPQATYTVRYGHIVDPRSGETVDEALLAVMRRPRSYTREDVVELHCHGGPAAQRSVLRLMIGLGARPAEPGEFTRRAFLNGRIDLAQAESVAAIVAARSSGALRASVRRLDGGLSKRLQATRRELVSLLASIEAVVDFSDDDVEEVEWQAVVESLVRVQDEIQRLLATSFVGRALELGVRTAIVGKPNAGKSSLLNALLMRERAIVSDVPGTTRDTVEELMEIGGLPIHLVDTAGMRAGRDDVERLGVARSMKAMEQADLVLVVVDLSAPRDEEERSLVQGADRRRCVVVGNKRDLVGDPEGAMRGLLAHLQAAKGSADVSGEWHACAVSALVGDGVEELRGLIQDVATGDMGLHLEEPILGSERQRALVEEAAGRTTAALACARRGRDEELVCEDIRAAAEALGRVTGEELTPDLLDEIFSRFCIGK